MSMNTTIYEKKDIDNHEPINIEKTYLIIKQLQESVCKIKVKNIWATGFFCSIKYKDDFLRVLITAHHSFNEKGTENNLLESMIKNKEKIYLTLNDDKNEGEIDLKYKRKIYSNKTYDTSIIEILPKVDKIVDKNKKTIKINYLSLDDNISLNYANYIGNSIYVLHYPERNEASVSYGIIKEQDEQIEHQFKHLCSTYNGSSGGPILNLKRNKVIGIQTGFYRFEKFNSGQFLKEPIKEFQIGLKFLNNNDEIIDSKNHIKESNSQKKTNNKYFTKNKSKANHDTIYNEHKMYLPEINKNNNGYNQKANKNDKKLYHSNSRNKNLNKKSYNNDNNDNNDNNIRTLYTNEEEGEIFPNIYQSTKRKSNSKKKTNSKQKNKKLKIDT